MKTKLLLLSFFITLLGYSQTINNFDSAPMSMYAIINTTTTTIDQNPSGVNATWDFTLNATGETSTDTYEAVTLGSSIENTYPGTTSALTTTATIDPPGIGNVYTKNAANVISITGVGGLDLALNYTDNNGLIGAFPLNFNDTNAGDSVSGTFEFDGNLGTFTGDLTTTVDAHGTLTMSDVGSGVFTGDVTRLKIQQALNLFVTVAIPINIGTVSQTSYYYYDNANSNLVFRTTEFVIDISFPPLVSINESVNVMESLLSSTLGTSDKTLQKSLSVVPNPVKDVLNFNFSNNIVINSITVSDVSGRQVLKENTSKSTIAVEQLNNGIYIATVNTDKGVFSTKFIKK